MQNAIKNILLFLSSIVVTLLIIEGILRWLAPQIHEHDILFQPDSQLGWTFIPKETGAVVYPGEVSQYIRINDYGFRDDNDFVNTQKTKKIMVIGDSFVTNIAVEDGEVFTEVMESQWNDVAVMNFGVNGYGQMQEYLLLEQWLPKVKPDLVIQVIYLRNDFKDNVYNDNWLYTKPSAVLNEQGDISIQEIPKNTVVKHKSKPKLTGLKKMHLYHFVKHRLQNVEAKLDKTNSRYRPPEIDLCNPEWSDEVEEQYAVLTGLLLQTKQRLDDSDIPIIFVLAPSIAQVQEDTWDEIVSYDRETTLVRDFPNQKLLEFARKQELTMIDLLPELEKASGTGEVLYNTFEQHWTATGNEVVAKTLMKFINDLEIIK